MNYDSGFDPSSVSTGMQDPLADGGAQVSPYPSNFGGGASPYPAGAVGSGIDPEMQSYLSMLGMTPPASGGGATPQPSAPAIPPYQAATTGGLPQGMLSPLFGLGISGQKAQQMPLLPGAPVQYAPPPPAPSYTAKYGLGSMGGGGGGGVGNGFGGGDFSSGMGLIGDA